MTMFRDIQEAPLLTPERFATSAFESTPGFRDTLWGSMAAGVDQSYGLGTALRNIQTPALAEAPARAQRGAGFRYLSAEEVQAKGDKLYTSPEDYKASPYYRETIPFERGMTEARAKALAAHVDVAAVRDYYGTKRPYTAFAGRLIGQIPDPLNYIPIFGEYTAATGFGRVAGRALVGSLDAAANTALAGIVTRGERGRLGYDTSWETMAQDVAFAGLAGAVIGGSVGAFSRKVADRPNARLIPETAANRTKAAVVLNDGIDGMVHDGEVRLGPNSETVIRDVQRATSAPPIVPVERPAVTMRESAGQLWFEGPKSESGVPSGELSAVEREGVIQITTSRVQPGMRRQGIGAEIYRNAVNYGLEQGKTVESAPSVSTAAARVYEALKREGYQVEKNPSTQQVKIGKETHLVSEDSSKPVYRITGRPPVKEAAPAAPLTQEAAKAEKPRVRVKAGSAPQPVPAMPERSIDFSHPAVSEPAVNASVAAAEKRITAVQGDPIAAQIQAAKDAGIDLETGKHDIEEEMAQLRARGMLSEADEAALKGADETFAAAKAWGEVLDAARTCVK